MLYLSDEELRQIYVRLLSSNLDGDILIRERIRTYLARADNFDPFKLEDLCDADD